MLLLRCCWRLSGHRLRVALFRFMSTRPNNRLGLSDLPSPCREVPAGPAAVTRLPLLAQGDQHRPLDGRVGGVDLDPLAAVPGMVAAVAPLGDDALEPHHARLAEHDRAIDILDMLAQSDAGLGVGQELRQGGASARPWLIAQIAAVKLQQVERVQESFRRAVAAKAGAHAIEVELAIGAADHAFAVEHHPAHRQGQQGVGDGRQLLASVVAVPGVDAHALALVESEEPKPVVFDLICPLPPGRHRAADRCQTGFEEQGHHFLA
jgi:hypothetical protein